MVTQEKQQLYRVVNPNQDKKFEERFNQDFEHKEYLCCLSLHADKDTCHEYEVLMGRAEACEIYQEYEILMGRTEAYEYIRQYIESYSEVDMLKSFVLVDGLPLSERKSIYAFMRYVQQFYNDGFDVDEYITDEVREELSEHPNMDSYEPKKSDPMFDNVQRVSMEEFMLGTRFIEL